MPTPQHLRIINPTDRPKQDLLFPQFPKLPPELRHMIWQQCLRRNRLLDVHLGTLYKEYDGSTTLNRFAETSAFENRNYAVNIEVPGQTKVIFRVSRESRLAAFDFYRVRLPYYSYRLSCYPSEITREKPAVFFFNPEYDLLNIKLANDGGAGAENLARFLQHLRAYDPQNIGLVNWAVNSSCIGSIHHYVKQLHSPAKTILLDHLSRIREVTFVGEFNRRVIGPRECFHEREIGVRFNHSMPIKPRAVLFDPPKSDHRAVASDLELVFTSHGDPRHMFAKWQELSTKWPTPPTKPARQRLLMANNVFYDETLWDPKRAEDFLIREEKEWIRAQHEHWKIVRWCTGKNPPIEGPEELAKAVRPAIGFWIFPLEVLGDIQQSYPEKQTFTLSSHWPELALLSFY